MSGPSHGTPVGDSDWNENDQSPRPRARRRAGTSRAAGPRRVAVAEDSAGRLCAVKTTCASVPRTRSARSVDEPGLVVPALDERELRAAGERLLDSAGSPRSRAASSAARARGRRPSSAPAASARARPPRRCAASSASCPVNTGTPSSRSSAARVSSVIAFSGEPSSIPSRRYRSTRSSRSSGRIGRPPRMSA